MMFLMLFGEFVQFSEGLNFQNHKNSYSQIADCCRDCAGAIRSQLSRVNEGIRYQTSDSDLDNKPWTVEMLVSEIMYFNNNSRFSINCHNQSNSEREIDWRQVQRSMFSRNNSHYMKWGIWTEAVRLDRSLVLLIGLILNLEYCCMHSAVRSL